jgi:TM2 domain-containing membrane protein YozV
MKRDVVVILLLCCCQFSVIAGTPKVKKWKSWFIKQQRKENPKVIASALCIAVGPFGGHRLYLGTHEKIPIIYTLTLGGGLGVLPLIDLIHIITTKDLSKYQNNNKVFMWLE